MRYLGVTGAIATAAVLFAAAPAAAQFRDVYQDWSSGPRPNGPGTVESDTGPNPRIIATDPSGNTWVAGRVLDVGGFSKIAVWKYDTSGALLTGFPSVVPTPDNGMYYPTGLSVNWRTSTGPLDVAVCGVGPGKYGTSKDIVTALFDDAGNVLWDVTFDVAGLDDEPVAVATDNQGNVFVAATVSKNSDGTDIGVIRYGANGNLLAYTFWDGGLGKSDRASDMAITFGTGSIGDDEGEDEGVDEGDDPGSGGVPRGRIFVTGSTYQGARGLDYVTLCYNIDFATDDLPLWPNLYVSPGVPDLSQPAFYHGGVTWGDDVPASIALVPGGYVVVTGTATRAETGRDIATIMYHQDNGNYFWTYDPSTGRNPVKVFPNAGDDFARRVVGYFGANPPPESPKGYVYVTGKTWHADTSRYRMVTIAYAAEWGYEPDDDAPTWTKFLDPAVGGHAGGVDLAAEPSYTPTQAVYVTGFKYNGSADDIATIAYRFYDGAPLWVNTADGSVALGHFASDRGMGVAVAPVAYPMLPFPVVVGRSTGLGTTQDYLLMRYEQVELP